MGKSSYYGCKCQRLDSESDGLSHAALYLVLLVLVTNSNWGGSRHIVSQASAAPTAPATSAAPAAPALPASPAALLDALWWVVAVVVAVM